MKVIIIGLGSIAKKHILALNKLNKNILIYALRHNYPSTNIEGIENIYSLDEIKNTNPNFIIISNPTAFHYQTVKDLVKLNIPLFIEKPLFSTIGNDEQNLISEILANEIPNYVGCNLRFHKGLNRLKGLIQKERIEEVNIYCGSYLPDWRPNVDFRTIYSANKEMGGGVHIDLIHEIDYIYWFFGQPNNVHKIFKNNSSLNISAIDYANYLFEYDNFCGNIVLNYFRRDAKRTFEIVTNKGTYCLNLLENKITLNNKEIYYEEQDIMEMYVNQMDFFINEVIPKNSKFNTVEEAYKILNLCY